MPSSRYSTSALLFLPALASALTFDCQQIISDDVEWNLKALGGPKTVHQLVRAPPSIHNTTFTVDICNNLKKGKDSKKDEECPTGTRICGKKYSYRGDEHLLDEVIPIAGEYTLSDGSPMNPKITRLKGSESNTDTDLEGLRVELRGGRYGETDQKAFITFICDKDWTGNEGFEKDNKALHTPMESSEIHPDHTFDSSEDEQDPLPDLDKGQALQFHSYKNENDVGVLRLEWKTKYACEDAVNEKDPAGKDPSSGWGFFTWFLIIAFLLAAAYIIFGSWLNYNRYGARGWDLIPHGDTIRDIPYIVKDWGSSLADRFRGDSRGGYSAV